MASLTIDDNSIISDDDYDCSYQNHFLLPLLLTSYKYRLYSMKKKRLFIFCCCFYYYFKVNVGFFF